MFGIERCCEYGALLEVDRKYRSDVKDYETYTRVGIAAKREQSDENKPYEQRIVRRNLLPTASFVKVVLATIFMLRFVHAWGSMDPDQPVDSCV